LGLSFGLGFKITPEVFLPPMTKKHCLVKFWKCQKFASILPH